MVPRQNACAHLLPHASARFGLLSRPAARAASSVAPPDAGSSN
jgi:hypothetical protein